jgi:hypothetical protein
LNAAWPVDLLSCQRCGASLAGTATQPAHAAVLDAQEMMVAAKQTGLAQLPVIGETQWMTLIAEAGDLQIMIHTAAADHRKRLFTMIGADLALGAIARAALSLNSSYGRLLTVSWLLADLPRRRQNAATTQKRAPLSQLLKRDPGTADLGPLTELGKGRRPDTNRDRRSIRQT